MFKGWGVAVCESCVSLIFEGDGGWTARDRFIFHIPCFIRAKHLNKLPQEVKSEPQKKAKK